MASKRITKTDLEKRAFVLTDDLSRVLHQRAVFPSLGGDGHSVHSVKARFKNRKNEEILFTYYASVRNGDRPVEERCWHPSFSEEAEVGDDFVLEYENGCFTVEIRPPAVSR